MPTTAAVGVPTPHHTNVQLPTALTTYHPLNVAQVLICYLFKQKIIFQLKI